MKTHIRKAFASDCNAVCSLHAVSFYTAHKKILQLSARDLNAYKYLLYQHWLKRLRSFKKSTYLYESHNTILGLITFVISKEKEAEILYLYIDPRHWHEHIGKKLLRYVFKILHAQNIYKIHIWVLENNPNSRGFYEAMGCYQTHKKRMHKMLGFLSRQIQYDYDL